MMKSTKIILGWSLSVVLLSVAGCTTTTVGNEQSKASVGDDKTIVAKRAEARWKALIESDVGQAYEFLSPGSKKIMSRKEYLGLIKPGMWREVRTAEVTCAEELCKASLWIKYDIQKVKNIEMKVEESWIKEEGNWWYVQPK